MNDSLAGVILAAGTSSRFGRPKQLLIVDGKPLVLCAITSALSAGLDPVVVVTGAAGEDMRAAVGVTTSRVRFVDNPDYARGQATSLATGLRSLDADVGSAAVLLADQPGVTAELIRIVVSAFQASELPVARPVFSGGVPGHPVVFSRSVWPDLVELTGDVGARDILRKRRAEVLEVRIDMKAPADVDTEADYEAVSGAPRLAGEPWASS